MSPFFAIKGSKADILHILDFYLTLQQQNPKCLIRISLLTQRLLKFWILRIDTEFWSCISDYMSRLLHSHSDHTSEPKCWWLQWRLLVVSFSYYSVTKLVNLIRCLMTWCLENITMKVSWNLQTQNTKCGIIQMTQRPLQTRTKYKRFHGLSFLKHWLFSCYPLNLKL